MTNKGTLFVVSANRELVESIKKEAGIEGYGQVYNSLDSGIDPTIQPAVFEFFQKNKPDYIILDSVLSGGINANLNSPADFCYKNTESQSNVIYSAWKFMARKLIFIGASCIYPVNARQPIDEGALLTGPIEMTSEPYALAKINGIKMCQSFASQYGMKASIIVPATLYGNNIRNEEGAHVLNALLYKISTAAVQQDEKVTLWGSGNPKREFLHTDDLARAVFQVLHKSPGAGEIYNAGWGEDITIKDLAGIIAAEAGFKGRIDFDLSRPDGAMQKLLNSRRINELGFKPRVTLRDGIKNCIKNGIEGDIK